MKWKTSAVEVTNRYRPFTVKYHGPSNVKGSRFTITDCRRGKRMMFGLRSEGGDSTDQAIARLSEMGITVDALALWDFGAHNECVLLSKDFNTGMHKVKGGVK